MTTTPNTTKQEAYKAMKANLNKSMKSGFYYQAIFIEYAIIEDRCLSALKHAGVKYLDNRNQELKLSAKLNKMRSNQAFTNVYVRKRLTLEFIDQVENWKRERDKLIHKLATIPYDYDDVKRVAEQGREIVKNIDNLVRSINRYYDREGR